MMWLNRYWDTLKRFSKKILKVSFYVGIYQICKLLVIPGIIVTQVRKKTMFFNFIISDYSWLRLDATGVINASIIVQLLASPIGVKYFQDLKKSGSEGQMEINQLNQLLSVIISIIMGIYFFFINTYYGYNNQITININYIIFFFVCVFSMVAGTLFNVLISNLISKQGFEGTSFLIASNLIFEGLKKLDKNSIPNINVFLFLIPFFLFLVIYETLQKHIVLQIPTIRQNTKTYLLKLKVNSAGILPLMMATSVVSSISLILETLKKIKFKQGVIFNFLENLVISEYLISKIFLSVLILIFNISYTSVVLDPVDISRSLSENGALLPGKRPGTETTDYLNNTLFMLNLLNGVISALTFFLGQIVLSSILDSNINITSVMIIISVCLKILESFVVTNEILNKNNNQLIINNN